MLEMSVRRRWLLLIAVVEVSISSAERALAQITPDRTLPNNSIVTSSGSIFNITGGTQTGVNLFHSFREFSVPSNSEAFFQNGENIQNIITRVTGGFSSNIDGSIRALGKANVFFLNPNGIVFGPNARLNVGGSFLATTASSFKFPNGTEFSATQPKEPPLLTISITPGLGYGTSPPGAAIKSTGNLASKQDLTLVADNLELSGRLSSGKNLNIRSVSGSLANINSVNTPILSGLGDVDVAANYQGASLLVEAKGNIRIGGEINITRPGTGLAKDPDTQTLNNSSALILRSGQNTLVYGDNTLGNAPALDNSNVPQGITLSRDAVLQPSNGVGGTVNLEAGKGDIVTQLISTNGQKELYSYNNNNGGAITLNAANGSISTGNLFSYSRSLATGGNGGAITLNAGANINTQSLDSSSFSYSGTAGNGGGITLSAGGNINTQSLDSSSLGTAGNGGGISLSAGANINTQSLNSSSFPSSLGATGNGGGITLSAGANINTQSLFSSSNSFGRAGNGGGITLSAGANINTQFLASNSSSPETAGNGGGITLSAGANINTQSLFSYSNSFGRAGNGGGITLSAGANINTQSLDSSSNSVFGRAGNGGAIALSADETIRFQEYDFLTQTTRLKSTGSINSSGETGSGNITINSNAPFIFNNGTIVSDTFGFGKAGNIKISAPSISLTNGAQLSASTHSTGAGGNITLIAPDKVEVIGETTNTPQGIFSQKNSSTTTGLPPGKYLGGYIPNGVITTSSVRLVPVYSTGITILIPAIDSLDSGTVFPSGVFSQTTTDSTASAGNLTIHTGRLILNNGGAIATTSFGKNSNAGNISINASDSITIDNGSILSGVAPGAIGNSGTVKLSAPRVSIANAGKVQTQTLGDGFAGEIMVDADTVHISGKDSALRSASGGNNKLLPGTSSSSQIGRGGNIRVTANNLQVTNGAVLDATTATNSPGGDITVSANTLSVDKSGRILTSTSGVGMAGNIKVNATQIQLSDSESGLFAQTIGTGHAGSIAIQPRANGKSLTVNFQKGAQISASTSSDGMGGEIKAIAPESITLTGDGSMISAETGGRGAGGNLILNTGKLRVENAAKVSVSSTNSGKSGSLIIDANSIYLDNQGKISADTTGGGGNIHLKTPLLILRRGSSITTNARGSDIPGGDIKIDASQGFILASPAENNHISANSANYRGGNVRIHAQGVFGFQKQNAASAQTNDITATGASPQLNGTVELNTLGIDPNNGLVELPTTPVTTEVAQGCYTPGYAQSSFVITGRGGLPPNPKDILTPDLAQIDWVSAKPSNNNRSLPPVSTQPNTSTPKPIVEATGAVLNAQGQIVLTANPSTVSSHMNTQNLINCHGS